MSRVTVSSSSSSGIGFLGLLTVALVVLKLLGHISISWLLVFLPIMIPFILVIGIFLFVVVLAWLDTK